MFCTDSLHRSRRSTGILMSRAFRHLFEKLKETNANEWSQGCRSRPGHHPGLGTATAPGDKRFVAALNWRRPLTCELPRVLAICRSHEASSPRQMLGARMPVSALFRMVWDAYVTIGQASGAKNRTTAAPRRL